MTNGDQEPCECHDGCNGCERLELEQVIEFLRTQRKLWPDQSVESRALGSLVWLHENGYEP